METCQTKAIRHIWACSRIFWYNQAYYDKFMHNQELFRHIQTYSEPCATMVYNEPSHI